MTDRGNLLLRIAQANPVDDPRDVAESLDLHRALLSVIDERSEDMLSTERTREVPPLRRRVRPVIAFAAGVALLIASVGVVALIARTTVPIDPADTVPTTQPADSVTSTTIPDSNAAVASEYPPLDWNAPFLPIDPFFGELNSHPGHIVFANGRYVAGGNGIWWSDDLASWTRVREATLTAGDGESITVTRLELSTLTAGPLGFVASWSGGNYVWQVGTHGQAVMYASEDGVEWKATMIEVPGAWDVLSMGDIVPGGPGWIAFGRVGVEDLRGSEQHVWTSRDGLIWDEATVPEFDGVSITRVDAQGDVVTAFGTRNDDSSSRLLAWTSTDGMSWEPMEFETADIGPMTHSIAIDQDTGRQVAVNSEGVWTSNDGVDWTQVANDRGIPPYTHPTQQIVWVGDRFIATHQYSDWLYESTDGGLTWTRSHPFSHIDDQAWPHALFVFDDVVIATVGGMWIGTHG